MTEMTDRLAPRPDPKSDRELAMRTAVDIIRTGVEALVEPGATVELRALRVHGSSGTRFGYFTDMGRLSTEAARLSGSAEGVFVTINPVNPELLARGDHKILPGQPNTQTSDKDITQRRLILVDLDPIRLTGISATADEHEAANERMFDLYLQLIRFGIEDESLVLVDSGNGFHIYIRCDLPNDDESKRLVGDVLAVLAQQFDDDRVKVDQTTLNSARISKLPGTWAKKGDDFQGAEDLPPRPHRLAKLIHTTDEHRPIARELLEQIAALRAKTTQKEYPRTGRAQTTGPKVAVEMWLRKFGISYHEPKEWTGGDRPGRMFVLPICPWDPNHTNSSAYVIEFDGGWPAAGCHHDSCRGKNWPALRDLKEPGWRGALFHLTDFGNAERLADRYGDDIRERKGFGFLRWEGHTWHAAEIGEMRRLGIAMLRELARSAVDLEDMTLRGAIQKHALHCESKERLNAMVELLTSDNRIADRTIVWDGDAMLLGTVNGVVDLRTGLLRPGQRADYLTRGTPVPFEPEAACPRWERFMMDVFEENAELIDYLHRAIGYTLTGETREQCFFFCHGGGRNGKTTLIETLRNVLGPYSIGVPFSTLLQQRHATATNDVASMVGRRLVTAVELNEHEQLNAGRIKALTGSDAVTARFLYKEFFDFTPVAKFWLGANHKPMVDDVSDGLWRRVRLIPFLVNFAGREDRSLRAQLDAELPGILAWAVRGCLAWQAKGLEPPTIVQEATRAYQAESDPLAEFITACFVRDAGGKVRVHDAYKLLVAFAMEQQNRKLERESETTFGRQFSARFSKKHFRTGWFYMGLSVRKSWFHWLDGGSPSTVADDSAEHAA